MGISVPLVRSLNSTTLLCPRFSEPSRLNSNPSSLRNCTRQLYTSAGFDARNESPKKRRGCGGEFSAAGAFSFRAAKCRGSSGWSLFVVVFQSTNQQALRVNAGPIADGTGRHSNLSIATKASNEGPERLDYEDAVQETKAPAKEPEWLDYEDAVQEQDLARTPTEVLDILNSFESAAVSLPGADLAPSTSAPSSLTAMSDLQILDACQMSSDLTQVGKAYDWLLSKGFLPNFGKEKARVSDGERVLVTEAHLKASTGLSASKLSPKKWGFSGTPAIALPIGIALFSYIRDSGIDIRPVGALILALGFYDALKLGGTCLLQIRSMWLPYKQRVLVHEAGHVLVAYLLGCPIRGVILDPMQAAKMGVQGQGGTQFWDRTLEMEFSQSVLPSSTVDRYSIVLFAGIAAEALIYGEAQGGETDENLFKVAVSQLQPSWSPAEMSDQARWAVLQAFQLLADHKKAHAAVKEALEQGSGLRSLIRAIEGAIP